MSLIGRSDRIGLEAAGGGRSGSSEGVRHGLVAQPPDFGEGIQIAIDGALKDGAGPEQVYERVMYVVRQTIEEAFRA